MTDLLPNFVQADTGRHRALATEAANALAVRFPGAAIGLTGSVAAGRHTAQSDVDLLVAVPSISRDLQYVFALEGIRVNVLAADPVRLGARLDGEAARFASMLLGYVLGARTLHDPDGVLDGLRARARAALARRAAEPERLMDELRARIHPLAAAGPADRAGERALVALLLDAWFLRRGRHLLHKSEAVRPFLLVGEDDPAFLELLSVLVLDGATPRLVDALLARLDRARPPGGRKDAPALAAG